MFSQGISLSHFDLKAVVKCHVAAVNEASPNGCQSIRRLFNQPLRVGLDILLQLVLVANKVH